ncbi:MAG: Hsp70 family protein [Rhodospirillum sp.]|nr:Hsp70 family protein [Rhodospirillum sp.]MCF8488812.1 Hsp70 family protein [Rhodospirillum sp.]MCF8500850.1 Hsp70 family protein [Rhodospirillum sp.]
MHCGLDFGTSNSTLGMVEDGMPHLLALQGGRRALPTAIFYAETGGAPLIGHDAVRAYLDGEEGRLLRSIKSILGTSLIDESTRIGRGRLPLKQAIGDYIGRFKRLAEAEKDAEITTVVHGRPVHFVDDDPVGDQAAEDSLREILRGLGFKHIEFQVEPLAAARHFAHRFTREALALVVDIGGGTSDFSTVHIRPGPGGRPGGGGFGHMEILGNHGIRLGGTNFDQVLSFNEVMPHFGRGVPLGDKAMAPPNWIYADLSSWPRIQSLYSQQALNDVKALVRRSGDDPRFERLYAIVYEQLGHHLAGDVEAAKIALSRDVATALDLGYIERDFSLPLVVQDLENALVDSLERLEGAMDACLRGSGLGRERIDLLVLTGGSTEMPLLQAQLRRLFPEATLEPCDTFGAVGSGLALEAEALFGPKKE